MHTEVNMKKSKKKSEYIVNESFFTIHQEKDFDRAVFCGELDDMEIFLGQAYCHIAFSDGTLVQYDANTPKKIELLYQGHCCKKIEHDSDLYSSYVLFSDNIKWMVLGELDEF